MASFNRVILAGNLTRDPEVRNAPSGTPVAELRLAISEAYRDRQSGETKETVCYVDVTAWGRQAELCQQYLAKGRNVLVEGRLAYDEWKNQQGETRSKLRVRADRIQFLGSRQGDGSAAQPQQSAAPRPAAPAPVAAPVDDPSGFAPVDDEPPF